MTGIDDKVICHLPMTRIDVGFEDTRENSNGGIETEADRLSRANRFRDLLKLILPERLQEYVCFVDYAVFQDAKIQDPYFYLVSPAKKTKDQYQLAVDKLVRGTNEQRDCFSVAYHPEFVGIKQNPRNPNSFAVISVGGTADVTDIVAEPAPVINVEAWYPGVYPLWRDNENHWPPTTRADLNRICGRHSLQECLEKFQCILTEMRHDILDSSNRPLTFVFCVPFLVSNTSSSQSKSNLPFSEIAAALFLGLSFEYTEEQHEAVMEFVRTLALRTYRIAGVRKAEATGQATGQIRGLEDAIESFAHQIKGVANAMSTKWSVNLETWGAIQKYFEDDPSAVAHLKNARVLPAPELIEAIRETLILWSQTRRIDDLYNPRPACFEEVINRAWDFTSRIRFALGNISRNLGESVQDIGQVWQQSWMMDRPTTTGKADTLWRDWSKIDLESEGRLCSVTRLLVAIFDNATEHGLPGQSPNVAVKFIDEKKILSLIVSNIAGDVAAPTSSRLRIGMKGNDVLQFLAAQLEAQLTLPPTRPKRGEKYVVEVEIPTLDIFFS